MNKTRSLINQISGRAIVLSLALVLATVTILADSHRTKSNSDNKTFKVTGQVEKVNSDQTFELVTREGKRYLVHVPNEAVISLDRSFVTSQQYTTFDQLQKWQHVSIEVAPSDEISITSVK